MQWLGTSLLDGRDEFVLLDPAFHPVIAVGDVVMAAGMLEQQFIDVDVCPGVQISS